jgi:hypothetical protein
MCHLLWLKLKREKIQILDFAELMVKKSTLRLEKLHKSHIGKTASTVDQMHHLLLLKLKTILQIFNGAQMRVTEWSSKMDKHQLLFIHSLDSTAKTLAMLTFIFQLQSITKLHLPTSNILLQKMLLLK